MPTKTKSKTLKFTPHDLIQQIEGYEQLKAKGLTVNSLTKASVLAKKKIDRFLPKKLKSVLVIEVPAETEAVIKFTNPIFSLKINLCFVVGARAKVTIFDNQQPAQDASNEGGVYAIADKDSLVDYLIVNSKQPNTQMFYAAYPSQGTKFNWYLVGKLNGEKHDITVVINHLLDKSWGTITSAIDFGKNSKSIVKLINNHQSKGSQGDIVFKGLGKDNARARIDGLIEIGKKAIDTNSYLQEDVLLVSPGSNIDAQPNLEILNNEVKASHGATLGSVDPKVLFYLMSRGLSASQAEKLIIGGFLGNITRDIENELVAEQFKNSL
ncbi:MAG: hypothetical protein CMI53_01305 [Parcubacteria group bacterium]|nr:hypothetical protein [Parcubacteria group bacterium]|tara:strand:- start:5949 stop:6920 length:972 start_codon:yes stop_codon:yes gene_type:complete